MRGSFEELADLVSMAIAAVYCFFLKMAGYYSDLYFMKHKHPHPYIRIIYLTQFIIETIGINLPNDFKFDKSAVLRRGMKLAEDLLAEDLGSPVLNFAEAWNNYVDQMEEHIKTIIDYCIEQPEFCRNLSPENL